MGADSRLLALFYRVVIQAVLMFGSESWALLDAIMRAVDEIHVELLRHITGKRRRRQAYGSWETPVAEGLLQATEMQSSAKRIGRK